MILEGIVTTIDAAGRVNIAPMGPRVEAGMERLLLRPYKTSRTYENLVRVPEGVFHVTDDVELLARAAVSEVTAPLTPAECVRGWVIRDACRAYEFRIVHAETSGERAEFEAEVLRCHRIRDFLGFNRARHAVVEAAILATRTAFLARPDILARFADLEVLVEKTGGPAERRAFDFLRRYVESAGRTEAQP